MTQIELGKLLDLARSKGVMQLKFEGVEFAFFPDSFQPIAPEIPRAPEPREPVAKLDDEPDSIIRALHASEGRVS